MKRSIINIIISLLSILSLYLLFFLLNITYKNPLIFPHPNEIIVNFFNLLIDYNIYIILLLELVKLAVTIVISFLISLLLVYFSFRYNSFKVFINPYIIILRSIPVVVIVSILLVVLGIDLAPYILTILVLIPISYQTILGGLFQIPTEINDSYRLDTKKNFKVFFNIELPLIKEDIKTSIINNIGLGFKIMIMAEFICYTPNSFGALIINSANNLEYVSLYAFSIFIILIVLLFEKIYNLIK